MKKIACTTLAIALSSSLMASPRFVDRQSIDETNITCMTYRCYSSYLGQFLAQDPLKKDFSQYIYSRSNPIKYSDPSGQGVEDLEEAATVLIGIVLTIVTDGAAAPLEALDLDMMGDVITESVTSSVGTSLNASKDVGEAVNNTKQVVDSVIKTTDVTQGLSDTDGGSGMELQNASKKPTIHDEPAIKQGSDNGFTENTPKLENKPHDEGYDSEPEDKDDNTHDKDDENKDKDEKEKSDYNKVDKDKKKEDEKPKTLTGKILNILNRGKEMAFFGGLTFAPEILGELKPSPMPKPKLPPKAK